MVCWRRPSLFGRPPQTVGHGALAQLPRCVGVPLYRRAIRGSSKVTTLQYEPGVGAEGESDEVEDLHALIACAVQREARRPGGGPIEAVSVGAVASDYQRLRVEDVCGRLGLKVLCPLWLRPQPELLDYMVGAGVDALLVKIAAFGLGKDMLGKTLAEARDKLQQLSKEYGCHACGEGGEYETLTLDLPCLFRYARLEIEESRVVVVDDDKFAPVAHLVPTKVTAVPRENRPPLPEGSEVVSVDDDELENTTPAAVGDADAAAAALSAVSLDPREAEHVGAAGRGAFRSFAAYGAAKAAAAEEPRDLQGDTLDDGTISVPKPSPVAVAEAVRSALGQVGVSLKAEGLGWRDAVYVHLYLADMDAFGAANAAYVEFIHHKDPPARACVQAAALPEGALAAVEVACAPGAAAERTVLHVQSISHWAAACIGPYAQAAAMGGLWHVAGQIGLLPIFMQLDDGARLQARHAAASADAVGERVKAPLHRCMTECAVYVAEEDAKENADQGGAALEAMLYGANEARRPGMGPFGWGDEVGVVRHPPLFGDTRKWWPAITFIALPLLPKGALVELAPLAAEWLKDEAEGDVRGYSWRTAPPDVKDPTAASPQKAAATVEVDCSGCYVRGRLASVRAAAAATLPPPIGASAAAMGAASAKALLKALEEAGLSAGEVVALRAYAVGDWAKAEAAASAVAAAFSEAAGCKVGASAVAAVALGGDANMTADVVVVCRASRTKGEPLE